MKKYKKWLFLAVILTFIWGCKKNSTTNEYFPHKDGNQWKYKSTERTGYFIREFSGTTRYNETTFQNWVLKLIPMISPAKSLKKKLSRR